MIKRGNNTKEQGWVRFILVKEDDTYKGVCLDFNIIEEGDDPETVLEHVVRAAQLHLMTVRQENLRDDLLNRHADEKYWEIYKALREQEDGGKQEPLHASLVLSPYTAHLNLIA